MLVRLPGADAFIVKEGGVIARRDQATSDVLGAAC